MIRTNWDVVINRNYLRGKFVAVSYPQIQKVATSLKSVTKVLYTEKNFVDEVLVIFENSIRFFYRINSCGEDVFKTWIEDQSISVLYSRTHAKHALETIVMRERIFKNATQQMVKLT